MGLGIPLRIKIMLVSNPLKSTMLVGRLAVIWLSRTKMVSVMTRGVSRETFSCFPPCPVTAFLQRRPTRAGGRSNFVEEYRCYDYAKMLPGTDACPQGGGLALGALEPIPSSLSLISAPESGEQQHLAEP